MLKGRGLLRVFDPVSGTKLDDVQRKLDALENDREKVRDELYHLNNKIAGLRKDAKRLAAHGDADEPTAREAATHGTRARQKAAA